MKKRENFSKKKRIFCNFITRGKKLIKDFLSRKFNETKKLKLKKHIFYGNSHFILVYENVFGYKNEVHFKNQRIRFNYKQFLND